MPLLDLEKLKRNESNSSPLRPENVALNPKPLNGMSETQVPFDLIPSFTHQKLNFPPTSESFIHLLHP